MPYRYFFDLPVYRLSRDEYYAAREAHIESKLFRPGTQDEGYLRQREQNNPSINVAVRDHFAKSYGGLWEFNEIIGYIRLHFLGSQVRGEYRAVKKKRIVRTRTKTLEFITLKLAPEIDIDRPFGAIEVLEAVQSYIRDCKRELPGRFIDTSLFDNVARHIDWSALYSDKSL